MGCLPIEQVYAEFPLSANNSTLFCRLASSRARLIIAAEMPRTIAQTFQEFGKAGKIALVPFVPAGYPDLAATAAVIQACDKAGAGVIEVGFPFSDPIADGPVIQEAFTAALERKIRVADVLATIKTVRPTIAAPIVAMLSYSIVFRYGTARFFADARAAGFDGLILPDLPPPEAQSVCKQIRAAGLDTILLVAPTTAPQRKLEIARLCSGFVYYLSVSGITGERDALPADLAANVRELKAAANLPVCVGFGIHNRRQIAELAKVADGAVIGSAIVRRMKESADGGPAVIASVVGEYLSTLAL
jgi:tryptophan synthase alpha chain